MLACHDTAVRAPEQGTRPKVFYKGADEAALDPLRTAIAADGMIWADTRPGHPTRPDGPGRAGAPERRDLGQVVARTAYTTEHPAPWKGKVSAYLVTKAVSAGALLAGALLVLTGPPTIAAWSASRAPRRPRLRRDPGALSWPTCRTAASLIFLRPPVGSWLVGAFILAATGARLRVAGRRCSTPASWAVALPALLAAGTAWLHCYLSASAGARPLADAAPAPRPAGPGGGGGRRALLVLAPPSTSAPPAGLLLWALVGPRRRCWAWWLSSCRRGRASTSSSPSTR